MKKILLITMIILTMLLVSGCSVLNPAKPTAGGTPSAQPTTAPTVSTVPGPSFAGTWDTEWRNMSLAVNGTNVTGTYDYQGGLINGTVSGRNMTGTWSEDPTHLPPNDAGDAFFTLSADGSTFNGKWRYGHSDDPNAKWNGEWVGTRVK